MGAALSGLQEDPWLTQRILANTKGEEPVKKKLSTALILCIVLGLAIVGTAYALFSSRVAEFFSQYWNKELGERLQEGKVAQIGESVTIGDVVFTLDEIVYRDRALYGVGTARPVKEGDIIVPFDLSGDPDCWIQNEEAQSLAAQAKASGGRMLATCSMPLKIGVDDGTMLMPGSVGTYDTPNGDGSVTYSFEASDGFAVSEGTSYQIQMESSEWQILENGEIVKGTRQESTWTVSCVPVVMNESADQTESPNTDPVVIEADGYDLQVPDVYKETGTMPVCRAVEADLLHTVNPEWFNTSGINSGEGTDYLIFNDYAVLSLSPDAVFYHEFADEAYAESASGVIVELAWIRDWEGHEGEFKLERTALSGITLEDAKAQAEDLIKKLGIDSNQYSCIDALDMSYDRIQTMGAVWEQAIADGKLLVDDDYQPYDYASIPAGEEGYYLRYSPLGINTTAAGGRYSVVVYVNSRGIVYAEVRNQFIRCAIIDTPETLITPNTAIAKMTEEFNRSFYRFDKGIQSVQRVALIYEAVRADNKSDGMVFVPVWMIMYKDKSDIGQNFYYHALINAVDGTLIDASFR